MQQEAQPGQTAPLQVTHKPVAKKATGKKSAKADKTEKAKPPVKAPEPTIYIVVRPGIGYINGDAQTYKVGEVLEDYYVVQQLLAGGADFIAPKGKNTTVVVCPHCEKKVVVNASKNRRSA
jgi:hypothetical protein